MDKIAEDLKSRTKRFVRTPAADMVARQLARAGGGVAGNYRSACRARSHTEFTARLGVVLEEADESELWLGVTQDKLWGDSCLRQWLLDESGQPRAIFSKACTTARIREHSRRRQSQSP